MIQSFRKAVHPVQVHAKKQMRAPQIRFSTQRFFKCRNSLRKFVLQMPDKAQALPDLRLVSYGQIVFICFFRTPKVTGGKRDRKSTRLNSSHTVISYAVFCLKKKINQKDLIN